MPAPTRSARPGGRVSTPMPRRPRPWDFAEDGADRGRGVPLAGPRDPVSEFNLQIILKHAVAALRRVHASDSIRAHYSDRLREVRCAFDALRCL
jgi:hypothetical protein